MRWKHWVGIALLLAVAVAGYGLTGRSAQGTVVIYVENAQFQFVNDGGTAGEMDRGDTFVVVGDILDEPGGNVIGEYVCSGVFVMSDYGLTLVNQRFDLPGGVIVGQGAELSEKPLVVVGGSGEYAGMTGTYTADGNPIPLGDGKITFTFELTPVTAQR